MLYVYRKLKRDYKKLVSTFLKGNNQNLEM